MLDQMLDKGCGCDSNKQNLKPLDITSSLALDEITPVAEAEDVTIFQYAERVAANALETVEADGLAIAPAETDSVAPGDCLYWQSICSTGDML